LHPSCLPFTPLNAVDSAAGRKLDTRNIFTVLHIKKQTGEIMKVACG